MATSPRVGIPEESQHGWKDNQRDGVYNGAYLIGSHPNPPGGAMLGSHRSRPIVGRHQAKDAPSRKGAPRNYKAGFMGPSTHSEHR